MPPREWPSEVADDEALNATFAPLLTALETDEHDLVASAWKKFESSLAAHLDYEEQMVTPRIAAVRLREALAILQEHRFLRGRLRDLGDAIARGAVRLADVRSFGDELRAHARHEEELLKRLPDESSPPSTP
jgi:hypothetical protein